MSKVVKSEIVKVIQELKTKGYRVEELAVALGRSNQTIYMWSVEDNERVPGRSDYEVLKRMTVE